MKVSVRNTRLMLSNFFSLSTSFHSSTRCNIHKKTCFQTNLWVNNFERNKLRGGISWTFHCNFVFSYLTWILWNCRSLLHIQFQVQLLIHSDVRIWNEQKKCQRVLAKFLSVFVLTWSQADGECEHAGPTWRGKLKLNLLMIHQIGDVIRSG